MPVVGEVLSLNCSLGDSDKIEGSRSNFYYTLSYLIYVFFICLSHMTVCIELVLGIDNN